MVDAVSSTQVTGTQSHLYSGGERNTGGKKHGIDQQQKPLTLA